MAEAAAGANQEEQIDPSRIFRNEVMMSDADLRIEVAKEINRTISGDEVINLEEKTIRSQSMGEITRAGRKRVVGGTYTKKVQYQETMMIGQSIKEEVNGGVLLNAQQESQAIVGGLYTGTFVGPYVRICAMGDFLCWGGYVEADLSRIEIAGAQIRAYTFFACAVGARISKHSRYIDDTCLNRVETIGALTDTTTQVSSIGTPGAGQDMET